MPRSRSAASVGGTARGMMPGRRWAVCVGERRFEQCRMAGVPKGVVACVGGARMITTRNSAALVVTAGTTRRHLDSDRRSKGQARVGSVGG